MQVTFQPKAGDRDRWEILVNGEKQREVHRTIFGRHPVFPPFSAENDFQSLFDSLEYRRVKGYILWRLSTQSYHSEMLIKLLRERLVQSHTIERLIEEMHRMGVLDDEAWLQNFFRVQQKRYSLSSILSKLHSKGFSSETLQRLAKERKNPEEEIQAILSLLNKRYAKHDFTQYKIRQKVISALVRKGYPFDQVHAALQQWHTNKE